MAQKNRRNKELKKSTVQITELFLDNCKF